MREWLLIAMMVVNLPLGMRSASPPQMTDLRDPFAIELPEIGSGLIEATRATDVLIPRGRQITRIKLWLLNPYADRVGYSGFKASLNSKSLAIVARVLSGTHGKFLDIDLRQNPELRLASGKNVLEVTARESESGRSYRCSFVLMPDAKGSLPAPPGPAMSGIRCEEIIPTEDPSIRVSDRRAPTLTLVEPKDTIDGSAPGTVTVRVSGEAGDDSGMVVAVTANEEVIAAMSPPPKPDKRSKKDKTPPPDPATIRLPFDRTVSLDPSDRALLIEARDRSGNRARCTIPVLRSTISSAPAFGGRKYAVLIGVSWYRYNEGGLSNLVYADADALAMREWLRSAGGGDFKDDDIVCLTNQEATLAAVDAAINRFLTKAGENDLIYLFLAGHGAPDPYDPRRLYFLLHDSKVTDLPRTAFPMTRLGQFLEKQSKKVRMLAFLDTCHSAGIKGTSAGGTAAAGDKDGRGVGVVKKGSSASPKTTPQPPVTETAGFSFYNSELFKQQGWTVIASSGMNELSREGTQWGSGHGVFTWTLIEGVRGKADKNRDCTVTSAELAEYVRTEVSRATGNAQNPQILPGSHGDLAISAVPGCLRQ